MSKSASWRWWRALQVNAHRMPFNEFCFSTVSEWRQSVRVAWETGHPAAKELPHSRRCRLLLRLIFRRRRAKRSDNSSGFFIFPFSLSYSFWLGSNSNITQNVYIEARCISGTLAWRLKLQRERRALAMNVNVHYNLKDFLCVCYSFIYIYIYILNVYVVVGFLTFPARRTPLAKRFPLADWKLHAFFVWIVTFACIQISSWTKLSKWVFLVNLTFL